MNSLNIPRGGDQHGGHPLERLRAYLVWKLPEDSHDRVNEALDRLGDVVAIRNGGGHAEAEAPAFPVGLTR